MMFVAAAVARQALSLLSIFSSGNHLVIASMSSLAA
jgi:hypothetical protein